MAVAEGISIVYIYEFVLLFKTLLKRTIRETRKSDVLCDYNYNRNTASAAVIPRGVLATVDLSGCVSFEVDCFSC